MIIIWNLQGDCLCHNEEFTNEHSAHTSISDQLIENLAKDIDIQDHIPELRSYESSNSNGGGELKEILKEQFGKDMILQEVVEVKQLSANKRE